MTFHAGIGYINVATVQPLCGRIPVWPDYFDATVGQIAPHQTPMAAWPGSITRTQGGFVLSVSLRSAPSGANAGMTGANYYYSMRTGKWTPLNQMYMVQTLTGTLDVGSQAVVRRTAPAAAGSTPPRYEYWLAVLRPDPLHPGKKVAYCLVGASRTNQPADLAKLETLATAWVVPFHAQVP